MTNEMKFDTCTVTQSLEEMIFITNGKTFEKWIRDDDENLGPAKITAAHYKF